MKARLITSIATGVMSGRLGSMIILQMKHGTYLRGPGQVSSRRPRIEMTGSDSADDSADNLKLVVKKAHPVCKTWGVYAGRYGIYISIAATCTTFNTGHLTYWNIKPDIYIYKFKLYCHCRVIGNVQL